MHKISPIMASCATRAEIMAHCLDLGTYNQRFKKDEGFFRRIMLVQIVPVLIDPSGECRVCTTALTIRTRLTAPVMIQGVESFEHNPSRGLTSKLIEMR